MAIIMLGFMFSMRPKKGVNIAILTSERSNLQDLRVIELADEITKAQCKEILEMKWLIEDISENGLAETEEEAEARPVPDFSGQPGR